MSPGDIAATTSTASAVPARARALAARLAALFEQDQQIVVELNDAHQRLATANDRLWIDHVADRLSVHGQIHRAFCAYQSASEQRRQLAVDVGELTQQLADTLTAAGHRPEHAQTANVHQLAAGAWQPTQQEETQR